MKMTEITGDANNVKMQKTLQNKNHLGFCDIVVILGRFHIIVFNTETLFCVFLDNVYKLNLDIYIYHHKK